MSDSPTSSAGGEAEEPAAEEPAAEEPAAEEPAAEEPAAEEPAAEEPAAEEPEAEEPAAEEPAAEEPEVEKPAAAARPRAEKAGAAKRETDRRQAEKARSAKPRAERAADKSGGVGAKEGRPGSAKPSAKATEDETKEHRRRRALLIAAGVVVAGGIAFGIDQLVSSGSSNTSHVSVKTGGTVTPPGGINPGAFSSSTLPGGLSKLYLGSSSKAVVSIAFVPTTQGFTGTTSTLESIGSNGNGSVAFVNGALSATLTGNQLHLDVNGAKSVTTTLSNGSFSFAYPLPTGTNEQMTFKPSTATAVNDAQQAFRLRLQPGSGTPSTKAPASPTTTPKSGKSSS